MVRIMVRWWLSVVTVLAMASVAAAQPGATAPAVSAPSSPPPPSVSPAGMADRAAASVREVSQRVAQLTARRAALQKHYIDELDAIDRLKKQRASWRRDRELRDSLSSSLETANRLSAVDREIDRLNGQLVSAQRSHLAAIDLELGSGATALRIRELAAARAGLIRQLSAAPRRIVLPDLEIDPLADPEELDQRAAELRSSEAELTREMTGLDQQATELERLALLRRQHNRAGDLFNRDDDQPLRGLGHKSGDTAVTADDSAAGLAGPANQPNIGITGGTGGTGSAYTGGSSSFESYTPTILAEVVDASTIASFAAAQRSSDPALRAEAAHKAHDAVARRLEQLRRKRAEIESRAGRLRGKH
jgi:hypothetical protein